MTAGPLKIEIVLNRPPEPKCKHCGRDKGKHRAKTYECPIGRGSFPSYSQMHTYEPRKPRKKAASTSE